jgi:hypothetical protein
MSLTDISLHSPENFTLEYDKNPYRIYDCINIYNTDSSRPMQKYMFMVNDAKVLSHYDSILTISISTNNPENEQIYSFIRNLEKNIGTHLHKLCKSNFNKSTSMVSICLYSKNILVYDDDNHEINIPKLQYGHQVSVIIKLVQVISDEETCTPLWNAIQLKIHKDDENICMFCEPVKHPKLSPPPPPKFFDGIPNLTGKKPMEKLTFDKPTKFAPSVTDILQIKNCLRKTDPPTPKCAIELGDVKQKTEDVAEETTPIKKKKKRSTKTKK